MSSKSKGRKNKRRKREKHESRIHGTSAPMPPAAKIQQLPYVVIKLLTGARIIENYKMRKGIYGIIWDNGIQVLNEEDYKLADKVAKKLFQEQVKEKSLQASVGTLPVGFTLHRMATEIIERAINDVSGGRKKLMFLKDRSGCGYWRMTVPSRYMNQDALYIDIAESELVYEFLEEYDILVVQRLCNWREYYTIERLKRSGKRIVYDIDDDIFDLPDDNPAARYIRADQYKAAAGTMRLCDVVTTTTEILKTRLKCPDKTLVIPNAIDLNDGYPAKFQGSDDNFKRILWMGSGTHDRDWMECVGAIDRVLQEREDVRLLIYGNMPTIIKRHLADPLKVWWKGRIEFMDFKEVETYVEMTKETKAECGVAPLAGTNFNAAKSNIKWLEYTAAGVPTIASNVSPFMEDIVSGQNGILVDSEDEWYEQIIALLDNPDKCSQLVEGAVKTVNERFDIKQVVHDWEEAILGEAYEYTTEEEVPQDGEYELVNAAAKE